MKEFDVVIIGAGISGAALFYEFAKFTSVKSVALLEKYQGPATLSSAASSNSQTIHCGDIETNYSFEKASSVKLKADLVAKYALNAQKQGKNFAYSHQKMALAVGEEECEYMRQRFEKFKEIYGYIEFWDKKALKKIEPKVVLDKNGKDRAENVVAMGAKVGATLTTIDFGKMSEKLIKDGLNAHKNAVCEYGKEVAKIEQKDGRFCLHTKDYDEFVAKAVVVNAGAHSLYLAHKMGVGLDKSCLPVAGSFYITKQKLLRGKVYTVQNPKLPFAAIHGDPDLLANLNTRFGPTALVMPKLERYHGLKSAQEFLVAFKPDAKVLKIAFSMLKDGTVRNYIFYNYLFEVPYINKRLFAKAVQKIVPSLHPSEIAYAAGFGGVRPQVIDKAKGEMIFGEASIAEVPGIIFNMTPSPGATSCLANARNDAKAVCEYLGEKFDDDKFMAELG